eukprot:3803103-Pyramimonas_sp.AAC.1
MLRDGLGPSLADTLAITPVVAWAGGARAPPGGRRSTVAARAKFQARVANELGADQSLRGDVRGPAGATLATVHSYFGGCQRPSRSCCAGGAASIRARVSTLTM